MFFDDSKISSGNFCVRWWIKKHYWKHAIFYGAAASVQYYCFLYFIFLALPSVMESSSYFRKGYALKRSKSSWFQLFTLRVFAASTVIVNYLFLLELLSSFGNGSPHVTWDRHDVLPRTLVTVWTLLYWAFVLSSGACGCSLQISLR